MSILQSGAIRRVRTLAVLNVALIFCFAAFATNAQQVIGGYTYTTVDCPAGYVGQTGVAGINNFGTVVGNAFSNNSSSLVFAFIAARQSGGTYACTPLPVPSNGFGIAAAGINDSGAIVGSASSPDGSVNEAFVLNPPYSSTTYTFIQPPTGYTGINARAINNGGTIVGDADSSTGNDGFVYDPGSGSFTYITFANATTIAFGINTAGQVVGEYRPSTGGVVGYSFDPATSETSIIRIADFTAPSGRTNTRVRGINDAGLMAGWGGDSSLPLASPTFSFLGWVGKPIGNPATSGYVITYPPTLDFTGSDGQSFGQVILLGLNNSGQISGGLTNDVGATQDGFVGTPAQSTPSGSNVTVDAGTVGPATISLQFPNITSSGVTTVTQIDPSLAGSLPSGYALSGAGLAFEIETTATFTPPIIIAFEVPSVDPATFAALRILHNEGGVLVDRTASDPAPDPATQTIYASVPSLSPFVIAKAILQAQVQQPINSDGSSVFNAQRGVVPVKFSLSAAGAQTCELPTATISLTRTAGSVLGSIDENVYLSASDSGSSYRVAGCQYLYNLSTSGLGAGTYRVDVLIGGASVGSGVFALK